MYSALIQNLSPTFEKNIYPGNYQNKIEIFLTCFALSKFFRNNILNEQIGKSFEEASLQAIYKALSTNISIYEFQMLIREMPIIMLSDYPIVKNLRQACVEMIPHMKDYIAASITDQSMGKLMLWREYSQWDYLESLLRVV